MARVEITILGELLDKLGENLFWQEYFDRPPSQTSFEGPALIVARVDGLVVKIFADEHPPPHFHVVYQDQEASFSIVDCSRVRGAQGLERYERPIRKWWLEHRELLIRKWNESRPTDCPVGPVEL